MSLYRVFTHAEHAKEFLSGTIRFRPLDAYRNMEHAARGDPEEGRARHREYRDDRTAIVLNGGTAAVVASPGEVTVRGEVGNQIYLCCFTSPPDEASWTRIRKEFGDVIVEVSDMERLVTDLGRAAQQQDPWQRGAIVLWPVIYNKGELLDSSRDQRDPIRLAVTQKASGYAYQHEHRIVLISHGVEQIHSAPPDPLYIRLPEALSYARIL